MNAAIAHNLNQVRELTFGAVDAYPWDDFTPAEKKCSLILAGFSNQGIFNGQGRSEYEVALKRSWSEMSSTDRSRIKEGVTRAKNLYIGVEVKL